ncbi:hypothetical protein DOTSEDRAFT_75867 [Dothistroma septosporum NZE10]|uniref:Calcineurin-like phosphoesterase domain-containing protein n=1 Tax=Dothistroma septosporum (strain NZE10 / CBS 128990) TaxID=675120 RepID=N1PCD5_DOTSN|nr:hypothetical protein DOTSEDRAFT_75867 [Dothistroma septosporum NZE10]
MLRMRFQHHVYPTFRRITRRYPFLRKASLTTCILTVIWLYILYRGERSTFESHIQACHWDKWEEWPHDATPHRLVFVADPQLVDPHTYPGRPWPLSSLTETYTDLYMTRNFRLANEQLDPDSIVFLGDLFDGGREWTPKRARPLRSWQRDHLVKMAILKEGEKEGQKTASPEFVPGEEGRWSKYSNSQWQSEYDRFGKIFFAKEQLYPKAQRSLVPMWLMADDPVSIANGAPSTGWHEYGIGGKHREVKTSLPGNHDLGFGSGVQLAVRDRFQSHFGETNSIYVLGNHTFVSLDVPSLSAFDEYSQEEMTDERKSYYATVWNPTNEFLDGLNTSAPKVVGRHINQYYPGAYPDPTSWHGLEDMQEEGLRDKADAARSTSRKLKLPVVLLSHVPLYRNPETDCGRLREKGKAITVARGYQYQTVLTPGISTMITKKVSVAGDIEQIFSGDDHDYCDLTHRFNVGRWNEENDREQVVLKTIREITVKSFSWAMGVRRPGFELVSLWNPVDSMGRTVGTPLPTIQSHLCLLPDQLGLFINYAISLGWTLLILAVRAIVLGLRNKPIEMDEDSDDGVTTKLSLPRYQPRSSPKPSINGRANGYASPNKDRNLGSQGRQRASSTSNSLQSGGNANQNLSVQRSYNARTRSVSPNVSAASALNMGETFNPAPAVPLIDRAGYFPQLRWQDPDDSDEESHVGEDDKDEKWKSRKRTPGRARRAFNEFVASLLIVAVPAALFYAVLIKNG